MQSERRKITLIRGDGIGPEIVSATVRAIEATGAPVEWDEQPAGEECAKIHGDPLPAHTLESIRETHVALKGPLTTPVGKGYRSVNVALRAELDLYANLRPAVLLPGIDGPFPKVDILTVRENTEGLYSGLEAWIDREQTIAEGRAIITRRGERIIRRAFEVARKRRVASSIWCTGEHPQVHERSLPGRRAGDGVAVPGGGVPGHHRRRLLPYMVKDPARFDVIVTTNLFGDI
ncbi:MAG: isocitrate/isopropylmalate family dehydrogenase [Candidatus Eisenbacteria bacterium]